MSEQAQLTCVSCDTEFDPEPNGGFCPDCDTPHPDYGVEDEEADADESEADDSEPADASDDAAEAEADDAAADAAAGASYCPECGADLSPDARADEAEGDLAACPDCGRSVTDESYCPDCGRDLDEVREQQAEADEDADQATPTPAGDEGAEADEDADDAEADDAAAADADDSAADGEVEAITLVVNGERYEFEDGDTFGRRDDDWLEDLVAAAGGSDDVAYVSGEHLAFSIDGGDAFVVDVSRNGTTLNGTDLDGGKAQLEDGDELVLAERAEVEIEL